MINNSSRHRRTNTSRVAFPDPWNMTCSEIQILASLHRRSTICVRKRRSQAASARTCRVSAFIALDRGRLLESLRFSHFICLRFAFSESADKLSLVCGYLYFVSVAVTNCRFVCFLFAFTETSRVCVCRLDSWNTLIIQLRYLINSLTYLQKTIEYVRAKRSLDLQEWKAKHCNAWNSV